MREKLPRMPREGISTTDLIEQLGYRCYFSDPRDRWVFDEVARRLETLEEELSSPWNVPLGALLRPDLNACDCQNPEPITGVAWVSEGCPIHNNWNPNA